MDYVKLLKRNENLNKEIFKLKNYIDNKINIIIPFSISNFSFEINTNKFKIVKPLFKKSSLSKRINSVLIPKKNQKLNNNYNNDNPEYIISTIETENNSLINKVQKLEDQLRNYLKNKIGKKRSLEQLRSYSQK